MGTFVGHALPGTFFLIFGVWWTIQIFIQYYSSLKHNVRFTSSLTFPCNCGRFKNVPIQPCLIIFFTAVGFFLEIYTGTTNEHFSAPGNAHHATMYFFFGVMAVINLMAHFEVNMPKDIEYAMAVIAFFVEWILFKFHLYDRSPLDVLVHTLLNYVVAANIISILVEIKYRHQVLAPLFRAYLVFLQGTWFWAVGIILYNPNPNAKKWDEEDNEQLMIATMFFAWHTVIVFLIMLGINSIVSVIHSKLLYTEDRYIELEGVMKEEVNGYTSIPVHDTAIPDGDDDDFERLTS